MNGRDLIDFLATPSNWPKIVLSSSGVQGIASLDVDQPLRPSNRVTEIFGLPPVLPLTVEWVCRSNTYPVLDVVSPGGVTGIASDCRMLFTVRDEVGVTSSPATTAATKSPGGVTTATQDGGSAVIVDLEMTFTPLSLLAVLAVPVLVVDNTIALRTLLPRAIQSSAQSKDRAAQSNAQSKDRAALIKPIDEFRALMGMLFLHNLPCT